MVEQRKQVLAERERLTHLRCQVHILSALACLCLLPLPRPTPKVDTVFRSRKTLRSTTTLPPTSVRSLDAQLEGQVVGGGPSVWFVSPVERSPSLAVFSAAEAALGCQVLDMSSWGDLATVFQTRASCVV